MNVEQFQEAVNAIADSKGVSHQAIINALHDALQIAYTRYLHGGNDARVEVNIDEENGHVTIAQLKKVVDEVQDDYLEISKEDALIDAEDKIDSIKEDLSFMKSRSCIFLTILEADSTTSHPGPFDLAIRSSPTCRPYHKS